jgi:hypothetical protein
MEQEERGLDFGFDVSGKRVLLVLGLILAVALAAVVGKRMSTEALAVVVGVVCGVVASVPTSLLLLVVLNRREERGNVRAERSPDGRHAPPVVVIQGGTSQASPAGPQAGYWPAPFSGPMVDRKFQIVGGDDLLGDDGRY